MTDLSSIARRIKRIKDILPGSALGGILVVSFVTLVAIRLLGQFQARLGPSWVPEINPWWLVLLGGIAFVVVPARSDPARPIRSAGLLVAVSLLSWAASVYQEQLTRPSSLLNASVGRASAGSMRGEELAATLESLRLESRRELNRLSGRRRDVALALSGYVLVPRSGTYRFEASCDDRCSIEIDGADVLVQRRAGETVEEVDLQKGLRRVSILYRQVSGPAYFRLSWDRPVFLEILPLEHFVGAQPDELTDAMVLWKHLQAYGWLCISLILWGLMFCVLLGLGTRARVALIAASAASARKMKEAAAEVAGPQFRSSWAIGVFVLALMVRVGFVLLSDQPLLYSHQYNYFTNALRIVEHPEPIDFLLWSDHWHAWMGWTIAPLYYLFVALVFQIAGPHLLILRSLQCVLDAGVAVAVAGLGRRVAGGLGTWAGIAYAVHWPAIEMMNTTMTENLHTFLLVGSLAVMAWEAEHPGGSRAFAGGFLLGLSALTRSVSSAFLGLAALWRLSVRGRSEWLAAALIVVGGAAAIAPWTARNILLIGEPIPIESVSFANLFEDNYLSTSEQMDRRARSISRLPTEAEKSVTATGDALQGISESPDRLFPKFSTNFWHLLRADGLHHLLSAQQPQTWWENASAILLGDFLFASAMTLFLPFVLAGRPGPSRRLILFWCAYYFALLVVIFHVEVRYRSALTPVLFAGAVGGMEALGSGRRRILTKITFGLGLWLSLSTVVPFVGPAWRAAAAWITVRPAAAAVEQGDLAQAERIVRDASVQDPRSSRPWFQYGSWLAHHRFAEAAAQAYRQGSEVAALQWIPKAVLPQLLREAGFIEAATNATREANALSWGVDPWILLEVAWRELPPPRTNEILLGEGDFGAVRGFLHPRGGYLESYERVTWWYGKNVPHDTPPGLHRWSRGRAWLRLQPTEESPQYRIIIEMGSPFPSPHEAPAVSLRINGGELNHFKLGRTIQPFSVVARANPGDPIVVCLDAPTWSRAGEPAAQGIRVDRMAVSPFR